MAGVIALAAITGFFGLKVHMATGRALCCADDAYFSLVAKHMALTGRYATPYASDLDVLFDPGITTGPALILPGALAIRLFGPRPWTTAVTSVAIFAMQIGVLIWLLTKPFGVLRAVVFTALALLGLTAHTLYDDYTFLYVGESTTFGYVTLGAALLAIRNDRLGLPLAGLCFSLALLTKHIALFAFVGVAAAWVAREVWCSRRAAVAPALLLILCSAGGLVAFEIIKLATLGGPDYIENWRQFLAFANSSHVAQADRVSAFVQVLTTNYGLSASAALFLLVALSCTVMLWLMSPSRAAFFGPMLVAGSTCHLFYILFISRMWPRYFWPGIAMLTFATAAPILYAQRHALALYVPAFFLFFATPSALRSSLNFQMSDTTIRREQQRMLAVLSRHPDLLIVGQSSHSLYDIIYLLKTPRPWRMRSDEKDVAPLDALVVMNEHFVAKEDLFYQRVDAECEPLLTGSYKVLRCRPQ